MKIFLIGLPSSGRTTVAKALCQDEIYQIIDASHWIKCTFRDQKPNEHIQQYQDEYHNYLSNRLKVNPWFCIDNVKDSMDAYQADNYVIDGIVNPKDFVHLFDYNQDVVVFLNRTDNEIEHKDSESIGTSVIRDYCFWMSSSNLLSKNRWIEYNFRIPGEETDFVKELGSKNTVFIIRNINRVISHLREHLSSLNEDIIK